jgi:hypothetical protein
MRILIEILHNTVKKNPKWPPKSINSKLEQDLISNARLMIRKINKKYEVLEASSMELFLHISQK